MQCLFPSAGTGPVTLHTSTSNTVFLKIGADQCGIYCPHETEITPIASSFAFQLLRYTARNKNLNDKAKKMKNKNNAKQTNSRSASENHRLVISWFQFSFFLVFRSRQSMQYLFISYSISICLSSNDCVFRTKI